MAIRYSNVSEDVAMYGRMNQNTVEYVRNRVEEGVRSFNSRARERYERMRDDVLDTVSVDRLSRRLEAAARITRSKFREDSIRPLVDMVDLQNPPSQMLHYMGANPTMRRRWQNNQCDGWSDRYTDTHPDTIGEDHYWYRRATQGLRVQSEDGDCLETHVYFERLVDGDEELDIDRQQDVLESWQMLEHFISIGRDDPTSKWNASLN